jgi:hypothetical protein
MVPHYTYLVQIDSRLFFLWYVKHSKKPHNLKLSISRGWQKHNTLFHTNYSIHSNYKSEKLRSEKIEHTFINHINICLSSSKKIYSFAQIFFLVAKQMFV